MPLSVGVGVGLQHGGGVQGLGALLILLGITHWFDAKDLA